MIFLQRPMAVTLLVIVLAVLIVPRVLRRLERRRGARDIRSSARSRVLVKTGTLSGVEEVSNGELARVAPDPRRAVRFSSRNVTDAHDVRRRGER